MTVEKAAKAGVWSAADILLRQGVSFLVLMVMARLLTPEDFGIVALVTFFSSISIVFVQGGLSQALIQRQTTSRNEESAVFWWNLGGSISLGAVLILIGPLLARYFGHPILRPLMVIAAVQIILAALGAVQTALLTRKLAFRALMVAGVIASLSSGAMGIGAALQGWGVWALAFQLTTLAGVNSLCLWVACDWRPTFHFSFRSIRELFRFGIYLSLSSALDVLYTQGFALVIGKLYGVRDLGLYNRAHSTQSLPSGVLGSVVGRIAFPLFSARASDREGLYRGIKMANSVAMILNVPAMLGLAVLSDLVMVTLFGAQWVGAAPILSILAIGGILLPLHTINLQLLLAQAQSRRFLQLEIMKKAGALLFVVTGSLFGILGLAWATVLFSLVALPMNASGVKRSLGYGSMQQLWDLRGLFIPAAIMTAMLHLVKPMLNTSPPVSLAILTVAGALLYIGAGFSLRIADFKQAKTIAMYGLRRQQAVA